MADKVLDPSWLTDLQAPIKSFRLFALERAMNMPPSSELLAALEAQRAIEEDEECQLLLAHAINTVKQKLDNQSNIAVLPKISDTASLPNFEAPNVSDSAESLQKFLNCWNQLDLQGRMSLLNGLKTNEKKSLSVHAPLLLTEASHPVLQAALIRTFQFVWPQEQLDTLHNCLFDSSLSVRIAALEALTHLSPQSLLQDFPKLLSSPDPLLQALAIRALARIDLDEAKLHLQALLNSKDSYVRMAGLQNCLFLPFAAVKPLLLNFIVAETNSKLIRRAGDIIVSNPDPEIPYKLWEAIEMAPKDKAKQLNQILEELINIIDKTRMLGDDFPNYFERLKSWIKQRSAIRFVQECLNRLSLQDGHPDDELIALVQARLAQPSIRAAFQEALSWHISASLKQVIQHWLKTTDSETALATLPQATSKPITSGDSPSTTSNQATFQTSTQVDFKASCQQNLINEQNQISVSETSPPTPSWESMSITERIRQIGLWEEKDKQEAQTRLVPFLTDPSTPPEARAAGLRAAARLALPGFTEIAQKCLKQQNTNLSSAALEYLGVIDPEQVFPTIGIYLRSSDRRLKNVAIKILKRFDPRQALSAFQAMLKTRSQQDQLQTLACAIYFDFSLIRETLTQFLIGQSDQTLLEAGVYLFQSNPEPENLYALYRIERSLIGEKAEFVRKVRSQCEALLVKSGLLTSNDIAKLNQELEARYKQDQARKMSPRPAYAYVPPDEKTALLEALYTEWEALKDRFLTPRRLAIIFILIVAIGTYILWPYQSQQDGNLPKLGAIPTEEITIIGTVTEYDPPSGKLVLRDEKGREYVIFPRSDGIKPRLPGTRVKAVLIPFRISSNKQIRAHVRHLSKLQ